MTGRTVHRGRGPPTGLSPHRMHRSRVHSRLMDTPTLIAGTGLVALGLVVWIVCVISAYQNAPRRGRRASVWTILTIIFGPFALFALFLMKPKPKHGHGDQAARHDKRADLYEVPKKH
jgi:hypothetical protein